jgi:hypothetical protein
MRWITTILCLFYALNSVAQSEAFTVTGRVLQSSNNEPMANASVFAEHTTFGTMTDAQGNFQLVLPNGGYELAVTFTGYQSESKRIRSADGAQQSFSFVLRPKEKEMEAVAVTASNEVKDGWEKYGSFFLEQFIGKSANSAYCKLENPTALKFYFSKKRNRLKVLADEALLVENKALGYRIRYSLDSFVHEYNSGLSQYTGFPLFEELPAGGENDIASVEKARELAFRGSILHFMRSVYQQQLRPEGFDVQFIVKVNEKDSAIRVRDYYAALNYQMEDSSRTVSIRPNQQEVGVLYTKEKPETAYAEANPDEPVKFQFSVLVFPPGASIYIEPNGFYYDQSDLLIRDYWTWEKIADMLPYDYKSNGL